MVIFLGTHKLTNQFSLTNFMDSLFDIIQDRVPAFSPEKARRFIESELGAPIHILFKEFENQPIAAASLGQVLYSYLIFIS